MSKMQKPTRILLLLFLALIPLSSVSANSMPPRAVIWFNFLYQTSTQPDIDHISVLICDDETCSSFITMEQTPNGEKMFLENELYCFNDWCRWEFWPLNEDAYEYWGSSYSKDPIPLDFKIIIRFSDVERMSNILSGFPSTYGQTQYYKVLITRQDLLISFNESFQKPGLSGSFSAFLLTLFIEPVFFIIFAFFALKLSYWEATKLGSLSFLVNLFLYPILWTFFPSITKYHLDTDTVLGTALLFTGLIFLALLFLSINSDKEWRSLWRILALTVPSVCLILSLIITAIASSSNKFIVTGLSTQTAIFLIELTAFGYEGMFIYTMNNKKFPLLKIFLGSLIMNMVSFIFGLVLL